MPPALDRLESQPWLGYRCRDAWAHRNLCQRAASTSFPLARCGTAGIPFLSSTSALPLPGPIASSIFVAATQRTLAHVAAWVAAALIFQQAIKLAWLLRSRQFELRASENCCCFRLFPLLSQHGLCSLAAYLAAAGSFWLRTCGCGCSASALRWDRNGRTLSVLRKRGAEEYGCAFLSPGETRRMNCADLSDSTSLREEYAFASDAATGYISARKIADHWVETTCGYCSVGCGMMLGVRMAKQSPHGAILIIRSIAASCAPRGCRNTTCLPLKTAPKSSVVAQRRRAVPSLLG